MSDYATAPAALPTSNTAVIATMMKTFCLSLLACLVLALVPGQNLYAATVPDPVLSPAAGTYGHPVLVRIEPSFLRTHPRTWCDTRLHITIDGSEPTEASPLYVLPFIIADTTRVRVRAFCPGLTPSREVARTYTLTFRQVTARPTFSPAAGVFPRTQLVTLSCATPGADIYYTTDGRMPTLLSPRYRTPLNITSSTVIRASAWKIGLFPSGIALADYRLQAGPVVIAPAGGSFSTEPLVNLQTATNGAVIRYTLDGSEVGPASTVYDAPLRLSSSATLRAAAFRSGFVPGVTSSAVFTLGVAPIVVDIPGGPQAGPIAVTASSASPDVAIHMTRDGSEPTAASPLVTAPVAVGEDTTLSFKGFRTGWTPSVTTVVSYQFPREAVTPVISPASGSYTAVQTVVLSTPTPGARIHVTLDGSEPTTTSSIYAQPFTLDRSAVVKAMAVLPGGPASSVASSAITLGVAPIVVDIPGGPQTGPIAVTATSASAGIAIHVTLDGSEPTISSPLVSGPLAISADATLAFKGFRSGWTPSATTVVSYQFTHEVPTLAISPATGTYRSEQTVVLSTATPGAQIYLTLDGSEPTTASPLYTQPFALDRSGVVKAIAVLAGGTPSPVATSEITLQVPSVTLSQPAGTYNQDLAVQATVVAGALVRYTNDGTLPVDGSAEFPTSLLVARSLTLSARAFRDGWSPSEVTQAAYVLQVATPVLNGPQAADGALTVIATSTTPGATFRYTTDGSSPLDDAFVTTGEIPLTATATLAVVGVRPGYQPSVPATGTYTVRPTVTFEQDLVQVRENAGVARLVVTISAPTAYDLAIPIVRVPPAAGVNAATPDEDFAPFAGTVIIPAGALSADLVVTIIDDHINEPVETLVLQLQPPVGILLTGTGTATLVISDDEPRPLVSFALPFSQASETAGGIDLALVLSVPSRTPVSVRVLSEGGTVTAGSDYRMDEPLVTFAPLQTSAVVHIVLLDDQLAEITEQAQFALASPSAAGLGAQSTHVLAITSDEKPLVCLDWNLIARQLVAATNTDPVMASRVYALLSVAQHRAARAVADGERPAAVATASCEALALLFPANRTQLQAQLITLAASASWPGSPSDDLVGSDTAGRRAARAVVQAASSDGADSRWAGVVPVGPGLWYSSWTYAKPPLRPNWGLVRPWFMDSGAQFRPGPPPAFGSPAFNAALAEVRTIADTRSEEQLTIAAKWSDGPGTHTPAGHWNEIAASLISAHQLDEAQAVHLMAVMNAAQMDAGIATWDAKFTYWLIRPYQADLAINTPVGQPNFPAYTSGHSGFSGAAATVLAGFFPEVAAQVQAQADEAAMSRLYGGIHYRFDNDTGLVLGRSIGALALQRDAADAWRADTAPEIVITNPKPGAFLSGGQQPTFTGVIRLRGAAQQLVEVLGQLGEAGSPSTVAISVTPTANAGEWSFAASTAAVLPDGIYTFGLRVRDDLGGVGSGVVTVGVDSNGPPVITLSAPADHTLIGRTGSATIVGTVNQQLARLTINGTPISFTQGSGGSTTFSQAMAVAPTLQAVSPLTLVSGENDVEVMAIDRAGLSSLVTIHVDVDAESPVVRIESPSGSTARETVTVTGAINDVVLGTVNRANATVTVNGIAARVVNRTFLAEGVPLALGINQLTALAIDAAGNQSTHQVTVTRAPQFGAKLALVSGDRQSAGVQTLLPQPIVVRVSDQAGRPLAKQSLECRVLRGDGSLMDSGDDFGQVRYLLTDATGLASLRWTVGSRAGLGNQRLRVSLLGSANTLEVSADVTPGPPGHLAVIYGDQQIGAVGSLLPEFLRVRIADVHGNPIAGNQVSFRIARGSSSLATTATVTSGVTQLTQASDSDGFATIWLTLGSETAAEEHLVEVSATGYPGRAITMRATARTPGAVESTALAGQVLSGEGVPVAGATVVIDGTTIGAVSDAQGNFLIQGVPPGERHVTLNGTTASTPFIRYPTIGFEFHFVAGIVNTMPRPFYLPEMDISGQQWAGGDLDVILEMPGNPEYKVKVFAHSTIRADGVRAPVRMFFNQVNSLAVPMAPQGGTGPVTVSTLQPSGTRLDPPAQIIAPNMYAGVPGAQYDVKVFDHDLGEFVSYGLATVDGDGAGIVTDPGVGYGKAGWGYIDVPMPAGDAEGKRPECVITEIRGEPSPVVLNSYEFEAIYTGNVVNPTITWTLVPAHMARVVVGQDTSKVTILFDRESQTPTQQLSLTATWKSPLNSSTLTVPRRVFPLTAIPTQLVNGQVVAVAITSLRYPTAFDPLKGYLRIFGNANQEDRTLGAREYLLLAAEQKITDEFVGDRVGIAEQKRGAVDRLDLKLRAGERLTDSWLDVEIDLTELEDYKRYGLPETPVYLAKKLLELKQPFNIAVDSTNQRGYELPLGEYADESIEDDDKRLGKVVLVNEGDADGDLIPDFADGFTNLSGFIESPGHRLFDNRGANASRRFVPMVLTISDEVEVETATLKIDYPAVSVTSTEKLVVDGEVRYRDIGGNPVRIWSKDGVESRDGNQINRLSKAGDLVVPDTMPLKTLGFSKDKRSVTLYVEGLHTQVPAHESVLVSMRLNGFDSDGEPIEVEDKVRFAVLRVTPGDAVVNSAQYTVVPQIVVVDGLADATRKAELVDEWSISWVDEAPAAYLLDASKPGFVFLKSADKNPGSRERAFPEDFAVKILGGRTVKAPSGQNQGQICEFAISAPNLQAMLEEPLGGTVTVYTPAATLTLMDDLSGAGATHFRPAPYGGDGLLGNRGVVRIDQAAELSDGSKFQVVVGGASSPADAIMILGLEGGSGIRVSGIYPGTGLIDIKGLIRDDRNRETAVTLLSVPIPVALPVVHEPQWAQLQASLANLGGFSVDAPDLTDPSVVLPGEEDDLSVKSHQREDVLIAMGLYRLSQILPYRKNPGIGSDYDWTLAFQHAGGLGFYVENNGGTLSAQQIDRIFSNGDSDEKNALGRRLQGAGPPLNIWRRMAQYYPSWTSEAVDRPAASNRMAKALRNNERRASNALDRATLSSLRKYFSIDVSPQLYASNISELVRDAGSADDATGIPLLSDFLAEDVNNTLPNMRKAVRLAVPDNYPLNADVRLHRNDWTNFLKGLFGLNPSFEIEQVFQTRVTGGWRFGHSFTEEILNYMVMERMRLSRATYDHLMHLVPGGRSSPEWPFRIELQEIKTAGNQIEYPGVDHPLRSLTMELGQEDFVLRLGDDMAPGLQRIRAECDISQNGLPRGLAFTLRAANGDEYRYALKLGIPERMRLKTNSEAAAVMLVLTLDEISRIVALRSEVPYATFWKDFSSNNLMTYTVWTAGDFLLSLESLWIAAYGEDILGTRISGMQRFMHGAMAAFSLGSVALPIKGAGEALGKKWLVTEPNGVKAVQRAAVTGEVKPAAALAAEVLIDTAGAEIGDSLNLVSTTRRAIDGSTPVAKQMNQDVMNGLARAAETTPGLLRVIDRTELHSAALAPVARELEHGVSRMNEFTLSGHGVQPAPGTYGLGGPAKVRQLAMGDEFARFPATADEATSIFAGSHPVYGKLNEFEAQFLAEGQGHLIPEFRKIACFPAGTQVLMADGTAKAIETIRVGEEVLSRSEYDPAASTEGRPVTATMQRVVPVLYRLAFVRAGNSRGGDGKSSVTGDDEPFVVSASSEHPFWSVSQRSWIPARDLRPGDIVRGRDEDCVVTETRSQRQSAKVYNLTVEVAHTYFIGQVDAGSRSAAHCAIWVHNDCQFARFVELGKLDSGFDDKIRGICGLSSADSILMEHRLTVFELWKSTNTVQIAVPDEFVVRAWSNSALVRGYIRHLEDPIRMARSTRDGAIRLRPLKGEPKLKGDQWGELNKFLKKDGGSLRKLSASEAKAVKDDFVAKKDQLIRTWSEKTGMTWPTYTEADIARMVKDGKFLRKETKPGEWNKGDPVKKVGEPYDAHHIISREINGPNEWWNMWPAMSPYEHQAGIHGTGSAYNNILAQFP